MEIVGKITGRCVGAALLVMIAGSISARQASPGVPAVRSAPAQHTTQTPQLLAQAETPQSTTATYGDWVVQCGTNAGPPPQKVCDMAQVAQMQVQGRNTPFSRVAVAHPVKGQPIKLSVQVPVNVSFSTNVRIQTGDADPGIVAPFARCMPNGCFADFDIKDDVLKRLRAASGAGKFSFADASGHDVVVPLSFKSFSQAFDALAKE
jgi:invasion protein IalB